VCYPRQARYNHAEGYPIGTVSSQTNVDVVAVVTTGVLAHTSSILFVSCFLHLNNTAESEENVPKSEG
jgi:hypothetical protein